MHRGPLACALWPLSLIFAGVSRLRRGLYRKGLLKSTRLPVPVIVVGNVFVGGTGKTPFTIWLVEEMRKAGLVPGVVSRGYGSEQEGPRPVSPQSSVHVVGDEPVLIAQRARCPVMVGRDRVATAQALLRTYPKVDLIISDDGLQHYALQRDVEVVVSDIRGDGNGWMLPAGPLREGRRRRRDFSVVNSNVIPSGTLEPAFLMQLRGASAQPLGDPSRYVALTALAAATGARRIAAAAGIGNPARFFAGLRAAGLEFTEVPLPDHYDFSDNPFASLEADLILITEKDAVKCRQLHPLKDDPRLWVVPVTVQIDTVLAKQILEKCLGRPIA